MNLTEYILKALDFIEENERDSIYMFWGVIIGLLSLDMIVKYAL